MERRRGWIVPDEEQTLPFYRDLLEGPHPS
jgi:hypothetical protein